MKEYIVTKQVLAEPMTRGVQYSTMTSSQEGYDGALGQVLAEVSKPGVLK